MSLSGKNPAMKTQTGQKQKISVNGKNNGFKSNGEQKKEKWNYSKSVEDQKHIKLKPVYDLFIGGKWVKTKKYFDTINPSNEEVIAKVALRFKRRCQQSGQCCRESL